MHQRTAQIARDDTLLNIGLVAGAAALTAVCAQISWGYPVPTTMQTFAVLGTAALLGARRATAAQLLYLAVGAIGAPVFAEGHSGITYLTTTDALHASGGYLWGFVLAAFVVGWFADHFGQSFYGTVPAMLLGSVAMYAVGLIWLSASFVGVPYTGAGDTILHWGLWPFVLGDLAKIFAAAAVVDPAAPWGRLLDRARG